MSTTNPSSRQKVYMEPEPASFEPITIVPELCTGCNRCVEACQVDVFLPRPGKSEAPLVAYPGECWQSGDCVDVCPEPGAIRLNTMEKNRVRWKRTSTGEDFTL